MSYLDDYLNGFEKPILDAFSGKIDPRSGMLQVAGQAVSPIGDAFAVAADYMVPDELGIGEAVNKQINRAMQTESGQAFIAYMQKHPEFTGNATAVGQLGEIFGLKGGSVVIQQLAKKALNPDSTVPMSSELGLFGAPTPNLPNRGPTPFPINKELMGIADQYGIDNNIPHVPLTRYQTIDADRAARVAKAYEDMPHDPTNPKVQAAYRALAEETKDQYRTLLKKGYKPHFMAEGVDPYKSSPYEAVLDVNENKELSIYPTSEGFGTDVDFDSAGNPLLEDSGFKIDGKPAVVNDLFRFVHDVFGHSKAGVGFRAAGEENAYQSHAGMYSPLARKALATETRGQNSWLNFGPFGETNRTANIENTVFGDQKAGLMPDWAINEGVSTTPRNSQLVGALDDDGLLEMVHYSNLPLDIVDPSFVGKGLSRNVKSEANRRGDSNYVKRSSYGIEADENAYRRENGLGAVKNKVKIDPARLYDPRADVEDLWKDAKGDVTLAEKQIKDAGYSGYYVNHPQLGKVAQVFEALPVTPPRKPPQSLVPDDLVPDDLVSKDLFN
tara:strand:+ start:795 stop:2459 length:1665 start_codon:yes stop_codon:yes gene_type:complete